MTHLANRHLMLLFAMLIGVFALANAGGVAAQQDGAAAVVEQSDTEAAIDTQGTQPLLQTTTLPWAFGDEYIVVTALPVAGSGDAGDTGIGSLPLFLMLIGAVASAGGAIAVRTRHAG